ncbi:velvet factor-domain-containing protein [Phlyctochytrium arcticum]|nr:velvet factor-domain-containing protein [Phlyctochytrium arcticum]
MCGFGGRDRRVVDPPPIIRLVARHAITHAVVPSTTEHPLLILHASLYTLSGHPANIISKTLNPTPQSSSSSQLNPPHGNLSDATYLNTLTGSLVSSAFSLVGLDGLQGVFFVFGDLSVRVEGAYKLGFRLCSVASGGQPPNHPLISTDITTITAETFSEPFTVYTAKEFPGMLESTNLTKSFARQGVRLPVRGKKRRGMRTKTVVAPTTTTTAATAAAVEEEEGQEDEEEEEEGDGSPAPIVNSKASSSTSRKTTMRAKKFPVQQPKLTSSSVPPPPPPTTTTTTTSSATPAGPRPSASPSATEPPTPKNPPRRRHRPPPVEKLPVEDDTHSSSTAHSSTLSDH